MVIDQIQYRLAEGISLESLREAADDIIKIWMEKQPGFIGWDINVGKDGEYVDFVYWETQEHANAASQKMSEIPADHPWLKCYDMASVKGDQFQNISSYKK